jgi:Flp pilus assembly protein TadG
MTLWASLLKKIQKCQTGQSLVETALILPVVFLVSFGMIDLSRIAYAATVVQAATEAGARAGIIDENSVISAIESQLVGLDVSKVSIDVDLSETNLVRVEVHYQFQFLTPINSGLELRGDASMLIQ